MKLGKLSEGIKGKTIALAAAVSIAMTGCGDKTKDTLDQTPVEITNPDTPDVIDVAQNSNAILENIQILEIGTNEIKFLSEGVDEDGIDHVVFYAIHNGKVVSYKSAGYNGAVSFSEQVILDGLEDDTTYEIRTVCYSIDGKTKSIEENSVRTYAKTPNDPSNDEPETPDNSLPVINSITGDTTITEGDSLVLTASATDADGDTLSYLWNIKQGTTIVDTAAGANLNLQGLVAGTYIATLEVSDGNGGVKTQDTTITVNEIAAIPTLSFVASNDIGGAGSATDDDLISVTYDSASKIYTFEVDTANRGSTDNIADVLVNITNNGYIKVNGTRYNNGEKFQVQDSGYGNTGVASSGTIEVYSENGILIDTYNYTEKL